MALYGVVATMQTESFAKVYVVYGGVFILMSLVWSYIFDNYKLDKLDTLGLVLIIIGIIFIYFVPRR